MQLSFNTLIDNGEMQMQFWRYDIPHEITMDLINSLELDSDKEHVLSFSRFIDFDVKYHGTSIEYFLTNMELDRQVVSEDSDNFQVSYALKNPANIIKELDLDQMLFLCSVFHALNLKKYLVSVLSILMNTYNLKFDDIKQKCKSESFKLNIFYK